MRLLISILILIPVLVRPQATFELKKGGCPPLIGKYVSSLKDETKELPLDSIVKPEVAERFIPSSQDILNFNITKSAIWCRFFLTTKEQGDWLLECKNASNNSYELFIFRKGSLINKQVSGIPYSAAERKLLGGHILFDTHLKPNDTLQYFIKVLGSGPLTIPLRVSDVRTFFNEDHSLNLVHGMYFGIMFLMILYNLFLFFTNRTRVYIYYICYIIFSTLFIAFFLGYIFVLPEFIFFIFKRFPVVVPAAFGFFGLLFTIEFLNTKHLAPQLHKAIRVFIMLVLIPVIAAILGYPHESVAVIQIFGIILATLSLATGITVLKKGYRPAKFYVAGFGAYMVGLIILIITNAAQLSLGGFENYALEIGSALEAIMLSFAIGDKLNIANHEKQLAQDQTLEALKENEKLIREQNIILERKVKERTAELEAQKDIIEEKNKEITDSIRYAKRIQLHLLPSEKYLEKNLERLKVSKIN